MLASVQLFAGLGLTALAIHTMLKLPSLSTRDCPLWAAGPLVTAGILGLLTVHSNKHYKSQSNRKSLFLLKVVSFALSSLSGVLCFVAALFLALHVVLYIDRYLDCRDDFLGKHCYCNFADGRLYSYAKVTCLQVHGSVKALFLTTTSVATLGGLASLGFLAVVWSSRYVYFQAGLRPSLGDQSKGVPDVYEQYSSGDPPTS